MLDAGIDGTRTVGQGLGMIRAIANPFTERMVALKGAAADIEEQRVAFGAGTLLMAALHGDVTDGKIEAGQSAGLVDHLVPAGALVGRIAAEYLAAVAAMPRGSS